MSKKVIFLDRDGVVNVERGDYTYKVEDCELTSDLIPFLKGHGIITCEDLLRRDVSELSKLYAREKGIGDSVAIDLLGTARLLVRKSLAEKS